MKQVGKRALPLASLLVWAAPSAAATPPIVFSPMEPRFAEAAQDYARIWEEDGPRIVEALQAASGLTFPDAPIEILVSEGRPMASFDGRLIRLRASYSPDYKKATLVHELGHRLAFTLKRTDGLDDHRLLYLFLYDVWTDLYGQAFADRMVEIERQIPGPGGYDAAWTWALGQGRKARQLRLHGLRAAAQPSRPDAIRP
jgi:hypothetical protein